MKSNNLIFRLGQTLDHNSLSMDLRILALGSSFQVSLFAQLILFMHGAECASMFLTDVAQYGDMHILQSARSGL